VTEQPRIKVLIAEDESHLGTVLESFLSARGFHVTTRKDGVEALETLRAEAFDVALLDIVMPEMDGMEVLRRIREEPSPPEVIIITGNGTIETAITAMKLGAYDYLAKPYRMAEIDVLVRRAWEKRQLSVENAILHTRLSKVEAISEIITRYAPMQAVLSLIERVARSDSPVLISGESGTGKELVARALHRLSLRKDAQMVDINCAAISEHLLESELFGHEKGSFTGASSRKIGLFELAAGGTLFMDEIGELDPKLQVKLLRALEQGTFFRVGGTQKVEVNVRIVAATNRDMQSAMADSYFRSDLYYRISTIAVTLPPLRDRAVDIPLLTAHFLKAYGGSHPPQLTDDAMEMLQEYRWPGNIRELRNVIERAVLLATDGVIRARDLPLHAGVEGVSGREMYSLAEMEKRHILRSLELNEWHQGRSSDQLGISSKTLYRKIREYGLSRPRGRPRS
jgi:DNA-binding NtrC family response regulator